MFHLHGSVATECRNGAKMRHTSRLRARLPPCVHCAVAMEKLVSTVSLPRAAARAREAKKLSDLVCQVIQSNQIRQCLTLCYLSQHSLYLILSLCII